MARSIGLAHIIRHDDGTASGVWGVYALKTAFQPIFAFDKGKLRLAAFEGLIRPFRNGEGVSPPTFFRNVPPGDRLHVETLTRTLHILNAGVLHDPAIMLFVNFDPSVYSDPAVATTALREMRLVLHEAGIDPRRIVCEVTEQKSSSQQALSQFVSALRAQGYRIAVDDYGAEDSDMERVAALKPDIVKFDAQWITRLMDSRPGFALLAAMVAQFTDWGITTVFEGIEEHWQLELAEQSGASMVQGYALARPQIVPFNFTEFSGGGSDPEPPVSPARKPAASGQAGGEPSGPVSRPRRAFGRRST